MTSSFVLKLEVIGDTHNVYVDDEMVMSNDVDKFADAPYVGIQVTTGNYVDDFKSTMNSVNEDVPSEDENTQAVGLVYDSFDRADTTYGIGISDSGYKWEYPANAGNEDAIVISNGTVISKNDAHSSIVLLTTTGVVTVKFTKDYFAMFGRQISEKQEDGTKKAKGHERVKRVIEWSKKYNLNIIRGSK